ncbi:MAG: primosomal protein N' [Reichenbachiella sp.]
MSQLELNSDQDLNFEERVTYFADVILPLPLPVTYTYRIPQNLEAFTTVGCRVIVQFGKSKILTGIVKSIHTTVPKKYEAKYILDSLDELPSVNEFQLKFMDWMASYYMCTFGEVMNAAIPSGLKLTNESFIQMNPECSLAMDLDNYTKKELTILTHLQDTERMSFEDVSDVLGIKVVHPHIKSLMQKEAVLLFDKIKDKYTPKKEKYISLSTKYFNDRSQLENIFEQLEKKTKQMDLLLKYLSIIGFDESDKSRINEVKKSTLIEQGLSASSLKTLIKNGVFEEVEKIIPRLQFNPQAVQEVFPMSSAQEQCLLEVNASFEMNNPVLLHGVTGSGKTEVYIELIRQVLNEGGQVLYLLPEIALTTQIVSRLVRIFGEELGVYHSKYSDNERVEIWNGVNNSSLNLIAGVRSSIFLPFSDLSLIIVDEEHDQSYKQYEPSPRYNARDAALWLANLHGAKVLMGTATPSVESYQNALDGKFQLVELTERFGEVSMPKFELANLLTARKSKRIKGEFTPELLDGVNMALGKNEQVIIFQNRRGYSPYLMCDDCNHVPKCQNCDVSLTYHMHSHLLICHYCGHKESLPSTCDACGSSAIRTIGYGTEKLEDDLKIIFPEARIQRMDQDTTRSKTAYQTIIDRFENGETDILVGTQMLSKGLHFNNVSLVGVLDYDRIVHFPDFRSHERAFQLITQVSGRSGRSKTGKVILQTAEPGDSLLHKITMHDYKSFFQSEILERENFNYPPFFRMIKIILRHKESAIVKESSLIYSKMLRSEIGNKRVLGPQQPIISRIRNLYIEEIFVKMEKKGVSIMKFKELIYRLSMKLKEDKKFNNLRVVFDVDPI